MATTPTPGSDQEPEETIVVERPVPAAAEEDFETLLVDRAAPRVEEDEATLVVERADPESTVVVERAATPEDGTVAVTRERPSPKAEPALPRGRRRRGMSAPPVVPGYGRGAVPAVGPGAVATYEPREIPALPAEAPAFEGVEATRAPAPSMPSVARRARRSGVLALAVFALACVVSLGGLIALALALFLP